MLAALSSFFLKSFDICAFFCIMSSLLSRENCLVLGESSQSLWCSLYLDPDIFSLNDKLTFVISQVNFTTLFWSTVVEGNEFSPGFFRNSKKPTKPFEELITMCVF